MNYCLMLICFIVLFSSCAKDSSEKNILRFGVSVTNPPFSYTEFGELKGFDIDLCNLIAEELKMKPVFKQMEWPAMLPALQNGLIDSIADVSITDERRKNFDFSKSYFFQGIVVISRKNSVILDKDGLKNKKISVLSGSIFEAWLKENNQNNNILSLNENSSSIEMLKVGHIDGFISNELSADIYSKKNNSLQYCTIAKDNKGVAFITNKNSTLLPKINQAIDNLEEFGEIKKLEKKWFSGVIENNDKII